MSTSTVAGSVSWNENATGLRRAGFGYAFSVFATSGPPAGFAPAIGVRLSGSDEVRPGSPPTIVHGLAIGFSFPVVPLGTARIRTQMSAGLTDAQLERALAAFVKVGQELKLI